MNTISYKTYLAVLTCLAFMVGTLTSCQKDIVDEFTPEGEHWESVEQFLNSTERVSKYTIPFSENEFVIERDDVLLHFKENAFKDANDNLIQGAIDFSLMEIRSSGEMLLAGLHSKTVDKEIIYSHMLYNFDFTQNGKALNLEDENKAVIYLENDDTVIDTEATFNWVDMQGATGWFPTFDFNIATTSWDFSLNSKEYKGSGYKFTVDNFGWLHMGDFEFSVNPSDNLFGSIQISVPEEFANENTQAFALFNDKVCVIPIDFTDSKFEYDRILINEEVTVVVLGIKNSELYFGEKHIISGEENTYDIIPTKSNYVDIFNQLKKI